MISRDEILKMSAGREMDILIAERVMGWEMETDQAKLKRLSQFVAHPLERTWWRSPQGVWHREPPRYSSDIGSAWQVVATMIQKANALFLFQNSGETKAAFGDPDAADNGYMKGKDAAEVICKAALAAIAHPLRVVSFAGASVKQGRAL